MFLLVPFLENLRKKILTFSTGCVGHIRCSKRYFVIELHFVFVSRVITISLRSSSIFFYQPIKLEFFFFSCGAQQRALHRYAPFAALNTKLFLHGVYQSNNERYFLLKSIIVFYTGYLVSLQGFHSDKHSPMLLLVCSTNISVARRL